MIRRTAAIWVFACVVSAAHAQESLLRVVVAHTPPSLGLPFTANGSPSSYYWHALFDTLTEWSTAGDLQPALAVSWQQRDPLTWDFKLRPDVVFSDGTPFDADAVAATITWLRTTVRGQATLWGREVATIDEAIAEDAQTVVFKTTRPDPLLPNRLTGVLIVPAAAFEDVDAFAQSPVGTGSFAFETWRDSRGNGILRARPDAWRPVRFQTMVMVPAPDATARLQAVVTGLGDLAVPVPPELVIDMDSAGVSVIATNLPAVEIFTVRTVGNPDSPVNDVRVRRAMNYAVNKQPMLRLAGPGVSVLGQAAPSYVHGHNPDVPPYPYDPDRARALLADAGYGTGLSLTMTVNASGSLIGLLAQLVAQDLAAVGIDLELRPITGTQWLQSYTLANWDTDLFDLNWNSAPLMDASRPLEIGSCLRARPFFCDPAIVPVLEQAQVELDADKRLDLLHRAQSMIHAAAPGIFLFDFPIYAVSGPALAEVPFRLTVPAYDKILFRQSAQ
jgi:peptide/nickel transport system substrate-binding protein